MGVVILIAILRPYKQPVYNAIDITLILVVELMYLLVVLSYVRKKRDSDFVGTTLAVPNGILMVVPLVYIVAYLLYLLYTKIKPFFLKFLKSRACLFSRPLSDCSSLPQRLLNSQYEVLAGVSDSEAYQDPV